MDASPTKAWLVEHRNDEKWKGYYHRAFARRPPRNCTTCARTRDQVNNVADVAAYAADKKKLADRLTKILTDAGDPRVAEKPVFDRPPFTDAPPRPNVPRKKDKSGR